MNTISEYLSMSSFVSVSPSESAIWLKIPGRNKTREIVQPSNITITLKCFTNQSFIVLLTDYFIVFFVGFGGGHFKSWEYFIRYQLFLILEKTVLWPHLFTSALHKSWVIWQVRYLNKSVPFFQSPSTIQKNRVWPLFRWPHLSLLGDLIVITPHPTTIWGELWIAFYPATIWGELWIASYPATVRCKLRITAHPWPIGC